jgi:hypothetical protein
MMRPKTILKTVNEAEAEGKRVRVKFIDDPKECVGRMTMRPDAWDDQLLSYNYRLVFADGTIQGGYLGAIEWVRHV